jgi:Zn-dependent protease with chaperone function
VLVVGYSIRIASLALMATVVSLSGLGCAQSPATFHELLSQSSSRKLCEESAAEQRLEVALERLRVSYQGPARVCVLDSPKPAAYSWSNGNIYLTRGLIERLNDDEMSAVIAHELGHLTHADSASQGFALGGLRTGDEQSADAVGIMLLRLSGIPPAALAHALAKVRDAPQTPVDVRQSLTARIALLPN